MIYKLQKQKDKFIEKIFKDSMKDLNKFYEIKWTYGRPYIILTQSRKEIDELKDQKTENWQIGWSSGRAIYVLDRKKLEKESSHKFSEETYKATIKHELSHAFFSVISKEKHTPRWLTEGVAIYTSRQNKFKKPIVKFDNFLNYFNEGGNDIYAESGFAIELLIKKYGKKKLLKLISKLNTVSNQKDFSKIFKKIYGLTLDYKTFNVLLKEIKL